LKNKCSFKLGSRIYMCLLFSHMCTRRVKLLKYLLTMTNIFIIFPTLFLSLCSAPARFFISFSFPHSFSSLAWYSRLDLYVLVQWHLANFCCLSSSSASAQPTISMLNRAELSTHTEPNFITQLPFICTLGSQAFSHMSDNEIN
jgi:hypothetical protein